MLAAALALAPLLARWIPDVVGWLGGEDAEEVASSVVGVVQAVAGSSDLASMEAALQDPSKAGEITLGLARIAADRERVQEEQRTARMTATMADIANARQQTASLVKERHPLAYMPAFLTIGAFFGFFLVLYMLFTTQRDFAPGVREVLMIVIGSLVTRFSQSYDYWMGTSNGAVEMRRGLESSVHRTETAAAVATAVRDATTATPATRRLFGRN